MTGLEMEVSGEAGVKSEGRRTDLVVLMAERSGLGGVEWAEEACGRYGRAEKAGG